MGVLQCSFGGFPIAAATERYHAAWPGRRVNFFDIPWTASTYGRGKILMHSTDLSSLLNILLPGSDEPQQTTFLDIIHSDPAFDVIPGQPLPIRQETIRLHDIDVIAAQPVDTARDTSVLRNRNTTGDSFTLRNRLARQPGIWEVEIVDERFRLLRRLTNQKANVREPAGTCMFEESVTLIGVKSYSVLLSLLWADMGLIGVPVPTLSVAVTSPPEDVIFQDCPAPIALDRILNEIGQVCYYNPAEPTQAGRWSFRAMDNTDDLYALLDSISVEPSMGGEGIVLPILSAQTYQTRQRTRWSTGRVPLVPARTGPGNRSPASIFEGYRRLTSTTPAVDGAIENTQHSVFSHTRASRAANDPPAGEGTVTNRITKPARDRSEHMFPLAERLNGFYSAFLTTPGYTLISYDWSAGAYTYIERKPIRPSGQLQKNRLAAQIRGEPHWVGFSHGAGMLASIDESGWLHLDALPMWFVGRVTAVYNTTNEGINGPAVPGAGADGCTVEPLYGDPAVKSPGRLFGNGAVMQNIVHAWCFTGSWIEINDVVLCFYIGHPTRQWVAIGLPPVVTDRYCQPSPASCIFSGVSECDACAPLGDKLGETVAPATIPCVGSLT